MSLRKLFFLLVPAMFFMVVALLTWKLYQYDRLPHHPCTSRIEDGNFIDENLQSYIFNGVITWWPDSQQLSLFGIKEADEEKKVFERTLILENVNVKKNVVYGKVNEVRIAKTDQLPEGQVLIGETGKGMSLIFKKIDSKSWLMLINDNWIVMCENK